MKAHPHPDGPGPRRRGLYVDVETIGFDAERDAVIELAMLPFPAIDATMNLETHRSRPGSAPF